MYASGLVSRFQTKTNPPPFCADNRNAAATYEVVTQLRDSTRNVFIGLGFDGEQRPTASRAGRTKSADLDRLYLMTSRSGIVVAEVDAVKLNSYVVP